MSTEDLRQFQKILTTHSCRVTKTREDIFALLMSPEPQSVRDLLEKSSGSIDRVSLYRNLELFEKLGIVHRIYIGWKYKLELSDQFISHHHHLSCLKCGSVIDIEDEKHIEEFITQISSKFDFVPRRHQFEIDGYCKNCR